MSYNHERRDNMDTSSIRLLHVELRSLSNCMRRYIDNRPAKCLVESVTGTNGCILGFIAEHKDEDIFQKDIEKKFGVTRSTASRVLELMEQKNLIERKKVEHDARLKKIVLTEKSEKLSKLMSDDMLRVEKTLTKGFTQDEIDTLVEYIERMKNNLKEDKGSKEEIV